MPRIGKNPAAGTFVTNDWRQLSAATNDNFGWSMQDDMFAVDNEKQPIGGATGQVGDSAQQQAPGSWSSSGGAQNSIGTMRVLAQEVQILKQDNQQIKAIVYELQKDRDNLRTAIRKLKVENVRIKSRVKRLCEAVKGHEKMDTGDHGGDFDDVDYEDIRQFLLIGGPKDPFAIQYSDAPIQDIHDPQKLEHKTCERYYWYKMAETFEDKEAMQKILTADDGRKAEEAMKNIKNFNQATWDNVKQKHWEDGQRLKFDQHRWIKALLVKTGSMYLAVASQDKTLGTGWRKQREEAARTQLWDGENVGGKVLMKLREEYAENFTFSSTTEESDALKMYNDYRRNIWKPISPGGLTLGTGRRGRPADGTTGVFPPSMMKLGGSGYGKTGGLKKRRQI